MRDPIAPGVHEIQLLWVKVHAIAEDDGVTLIDNGYAGSLPKIEQGLAALGRSIEDVRRVICTHGHPDHAGSRWPSPLRGDVELVLGDPLLFDADTDHAVATTRLEAAVAAL